MPISQTPKEIIAGLYAAVFNRAPDKEGLDFWNAQADGGDAIEVYQDIMDPAGNATGFVDHPVFKADYDGLTNAEFAAKIYENALGQAGDQEGINFWTAQLDLGLSRGDMVVEFVQGALTGDFTAENFPGLTADELTAARERQDYLQNKVNVAIHWIDELGDKTNVTDANDPTSDPAYIASISVLKEVNQDPATVDHMNAIIDTASAASDSMQSIIDHVNGHVVIDEDTFSLTANPDTATANVFNAGRVWDPSGNDQLNSLNDDDVLTGTGTNPTLNVNFINDIDSGDMDVMPTLNNIETVNVKFSADTGQTIDFQDTTGLKHANAERIDGGANVTFDNIQSVLETATVKNSNDNTASNVVFDHSAAVLNGDADEVALTLSDVQMNGIRIDGVTEGYETINISSEGGANTFNALTAESVQTLNIAGDQDFRIGGTNNVVNGALVEASTQTAGLVNVAGSLTKVDASSFTGALTYHIGGEINANADADGSAVALEVISGVADDKFVLVNGNNIDAVAGNTDIIDGGEGTNSLIITGGVAQVVASPATGANLKNIQNLEIRTGQDAAVVADVVTVDADAFDSLASITVRNEGQNALASAAEAMTVNLNDLTVDQAKTIVVEHGTTGNNSLANNTIISDVKTNTAADTLGITLSNAINTDVSFNLGLTDSTGTSFENITITDSDSENNTVKLNSFANQTGTITVTGGEAGDFMNLDATDFLGAGTPRAGAYGKDVSGTTARDYTVITAGSTASAAAANFNQDPSTNNAAGTISYRDNAVDHVLSTSNGNLGELLVATNIVATDYKGDFIARMGTADQDIKLGSGNDTIIFADQAGTTNATAGLNILDKVDGGAGNDTIVIDGTGNVVLGASEWTNLQGIDTIHVAGVINPANSTRLLITDQLVDQTDAGNRITVINNDGSLAAQTENALTLDLRQMGATNAITFVGPNLAGQPIGLPNVNPVTTLASSAQTVIVDDVTANGASILDGGDRDIITSYTPTGIDHTRAVFGTQAVADAAWNTNVTAGIDGNNNVLAYHATTATNEVTVGDLTNTKNFSTLTFDNDTAQAVTYTVTLNDAVMDNLVDASHAANTVAVETLTMTANGNAAVPLATGALNLNASAVTAKFATNITLGNGADSLNLGASADTITVDDGATTHYTATVQAGGGAWIQTAAATGVIAAGDTVTTTEVITGLTTGDSINMTNAAIVADADATVIDNEYMILSGVYDAATGVFTVAGTPAAAAAGADTMLVFDTDATAGIDFETLVLVGVTDVEAAAATLNGGTLTF